MNILEVTGLCKSFGAIEVISNLTFSIKAGERHAIIGPNGAGKTTLFNLITGWDKPSSGEIYIEGAPCHGMSPQAVTRCGFSRSFQRNMLLEGLTVIENIRLACQAVNSSRRSVFGSCHGFPDVINAAKSIASQMQLGEVHHREVKHLSYGQKRQLEVAIALCSNPRILLLDEPAAGTSPKERKQLIELIQKLPAEITLLLVEHDMDVVFNVAEKITVLSYGTMLASGTPQEIRSNPQVREAYLGKRSNA
jgi:branched-chain amino acid transport system ATP-binding protein